MHCFRFCLLICCLGVLSCQRNPEPAPENTKKQALVKTVVPKASPKKNKPFVLNDENAIPFFYEYAQKNLENKVRIHTRLGSFDILLFSQTPYHRANFIYLTRKKYFDGTYFHRVVKDFIIQGGNSDNPETGQKRRKIGKYLLPPDTDSGFRHDRGIVSMPSSEIENPHKLASPYEFFIVQKKGGAHHLNGNYTAFGKVIRGMEVVDKIANLPTDKREWPIENVYIKAEVLK